MKPRLLIRLAVTASIVLLCTGFALYSYFRLTAIEKGGEVDLYTLVPADATAVFETDDMTGFIEGLNGMSSTRNGVQPGVSPLFALVRANYASLDGETAHGLSEEMNKVIISFHGGENGGEQVLYCLLSQTDRNLVNRFVGKYVSGQYPPKTALYRGHKIRIYPLTDGNFLAVYLTSRFLVISYQKHLIESVIDTEISGHNLLDEKGFRGVYNGKSSNRPAKLYVRMLPTSMGNLADSRRPSALLSGWVGLDFAFNSESLFLSGNTAVADTAFTFLHTLRTQQAVDSFPGAFLPASTFMFSRRSISDLPALHRYSSGWDFRGDSSVSYVQQRDDELFGYLSQYAGKALTTALFHAPDTLADPCAVMAIPINDMAPAQQSFREWITSLPADTLGQLLPSRMYLRVQQQNLVCWRLPRTTLFARFTGITRPGLNPVVCFYDNRMFWAPDVRSLSAYIEFMLRKEVLQGKTAYEEAVSGMAPSYQYMLMADLADVFRQPAAYVRTLPSFFFKHADYFSHFVLSVQFTCADGEVEPHLALLYKGG